MRLYRYSETDPCTRSTFKPRIVDNHGVKAVYDFSRFDHGTERKSDFRVYVEWSDVEAVIQAFVESGLDKAVKLKRVSATLEAIRSVLDSAHCDEAYDIDSGQVMNPRLS